MSSIRPTRPHLVERAMLAAAVPAAVAPEPPPAPVAPPAFEDVPPAGPTEDLAPRLRLEVLLRAGLVGPAAARSRLAEEIALVREQVMRNVASAATEAGRSDRIVLVTSARPGEGKSFAALNIAASIAAGTQQRALLVDTEGEAGSLTGLLGLAAHPGLEALMAEPDLDAGTLLVPTELPQLDLLPRGRPAADRARAPQGSAMNAALLRIAQALPRHIIVLDATACLSSSDPGLLAAAAGQVVMVVEAERTQRAELEAALDIVDSCPNLQLLLNRIRLTVSDSFGDRGTAGDHVGGSASA
ncbi:P-loop NTPase family protein [Neoroseomonas soli]|uniref:Capsular biosynthesis protein n=1 Tax=Neoroseomonas soli TaxID=1081025 RepID=A0A9X9WSN6_9PROT|nr:hypothetical protein [Neoroseomonas soli]MBR0670165.1 hypothetical protein [Neoroseomonas soli]